MRIETPDPKPRSEGAYEIEVTPGYGKPTGDIVLDENRQLRLQWLNAGDCDRLIEAATEIRERVMAYSAEAAAPHGRRHIYKGICQLCGKPEEDSDLHDNPKITVSHQSVVG